jgi:hypothetical protein
MSGSHGDLFHEIGKLVLAAHAGQAIDLDAKSEELAARYANLGMPSDLIARAIARSLSAISVSMAIISSRRVNGETVGANGHGINGEGANGHHANGHQVNGHEANGDETNGHNGGTLNGNGHANGNGEALEANGVDLDAEEEAAEPTEEQARAAAALFPSGLRIAVLS